MHPWIPAAPPGVRAGPAVQFLIQQFAKGPCHSFVPAVLEMYVQGGFSQTLSGEVGLSEIQIVFVNVFICPETMKWNPESSRETHFEETVAHSESSW